MLAAPWPESIREAEEVFLVNRVQHRDCRPLDDLVFEGRNRERALTAVRLRDEPAPGRLRPVGAPVDPRVQILNPAIKVSLVGPPCEPVHTGSGVPLEREERGPEHGRVEMVEERREPLRLPLSCSLPYACQRLGHACPVLSPARALLARVPLGPRPSLHRLRSRLPGVVRRLRRYYGEV